MTAELKLVFSSVLFFYSFSDWSLLHPQGQEELKHDLLKRKDLEPRGSQARRRDGRELSLSFLRPLPPSYLPRMRYALKLHRHLTWSS